MLYERMNGNGELTETENAIFYVSYGVLTEFLRMNVILRYGYGNGYGNGYGTVEIRHYSNIRCRLYVNIVNGSKVIAV